MIKLDLDVKDCYEWGNVEIKIRSSISTFTTFDLMTTDDIEKLEQDLTSMTQKLYEYRKNKGQS